MPAAPRPHPSRFAATWTAAALTEALACGRRCPCRRAVERGQGQVHCPAHQDRSPSLSVQQGDGRLLVHCKAGCRQEAVVAALRGRGLWPQPVVGRVTAYAYVSADGELLARHLREQRPGGGKRIWWEGASGRPSRGGVRPEGLPLYGLPRLLGADPALPVLLVEGETCAEAALAAGALAVSLAGGASQRQFGAALEPLRRRTVILWPDHDAPGRALMRAVGAALLSLGAAVRWLEPATLSSPPPPPGYDVADWLAAGHDRADLQALLEGAGPLPPAEGEQQSPASAVPMLPPAPPLPLTALPPVLRTLVEQGAAALDCPPDLVAVPALAFVAACLGDRFTLLIKEGWTERAQLWCAVVAVPGSAKSPALALAGRAVSVLQQEARAQYLRELAAYEEESDRRSAQKPGAARGERPERPEMMHYFSTDPTPEAIARILGHPQTRTPGLVVMRDELVAFVKSFDVYRGGRGGERQAWLSLWAGQEFKSDRAGREPYFVPAPTVAVTGGIQPEMLGALQQEAGQRDGFIERFLFAYPETRPMRWTDSVVPAATVAALTEVLRSLRCTAPAGVVQMEEAARESFRRWVDDNAEAQERVGGLTRGLYGKLPGQAARLALILHALRCPWAPAAVPVAAATMAAALTLVEYFRAHALRTLSHFGEAAAGLSPLALRLLRLLREGDGWLSRTTLYDQLGSHLTSADISAALGELAVAALAERRVLASGEAGGRPVEEWRAAMQPPIPCGLSVITGETSPVAGVFTVFTDSSQPFIAATTPGDDEPFAL